MHKKKPQHKKNRFLKMVLFVFFLITLLFSGFLFFISHNLPSIEEIKKTGRKPSVMFENAQGHILTSYGDIYGETITPKDLPPHVIWAFLAAEDRRFYSHFGIDIFGIFRALSSNIFKKHSLQGASTITQQLAKNFLISTQRFDHSNRSLKRKIEEVMMSFWLEKTFSKDEILMMYLNRSYFGSGTLGIDAAARKYFGKSAKQLTIMESATLAGLLKAPSKYSPHHNPELALKRAKIVLKSMINAKFIKDETFSSPEFTTLDQGGSSIRYLFDWVLDSTPNLIGLINEDITITTTLDLYIQQQADHILKEFLTNNKINASQGAIIVLDKTGAVKAMVGGKNYRKSSFNRATQALRQSGSAFKFFVYLAALENGFEPSSLVEDKRRVYQKWSPKNYINQYAGTVSIRNAFAQSLNTVSVDLCDKVGTSKVIEMARRLGVTSAIPHNLSIALGSCDNTLLEMTCAYATVANMGQEVKPFGVLSIHTRNNKDLYKHDPQKPSQLIDVLVAQKMDDLLKEVVSSGTGKKAYIENMSLAGKTGTTQNHKDAWFIGYTDEYTIGVWIGNDDGSGMKKATGGSGPAAIFKNLVQNIHQNKNKSSIDAILKDLEN